MAVKIGSLIIQLAVEHGLLKSGLSVAEKEVKKTTREIEKQGRQIADFGRSMALAVTLPMAAIAKSAVDGFVEQQKAMADVNAALASMGNQSGKTAGELAKTADQLEMRSLYDAEVILKQVTAQLLTFGAIAGREFDRAQQAAIDMATRLGSEPQAAAIMLGKALQAPAKGLTALGKTGAITQDWIAANKARIQGMLDEGRIAEAQGLILSAVEQQVRGAAAAAADATPWRAAQVAIGQAMDTIGEAVLPLVKQVADAVAKMAQEFNKLSPEMKQTILTAAAVAAALGPVLIGIGALIQIGAPTIAMFVTMASAGGTLVLALRNVALAATGVGIVIVALGLDFQQVTAFVAGASVAYGVYRAAAAAAALATQAMSSQIALQAAAVISSTRVMGGLTAAKLALSGVIGTVTGGFRVLTATLLANPFTAVAATVGILAGAMVTLGEKQRQARTETDNLITSLKALARARSEDFALKRAEADIERRNAESRLREIRAEQRRRGESSTSNLFRGIAASGVQNSALEQEAQELTWKIIELEGSLKASDRAYREASRAAEEMVVPVAQSGAAAEAAGKKIKGLADAAKPANDALLDLVETLFPERRSRAQMAQLDALDKGAERLKALGIDLSEARVRALGVKGTSKVSDRLLNEGPLKEAEATAERIEDMYDLILKAAEKSGRPATELMGLSLTKLRQIADEQTVKIADSFQEMTNRALGALRQLADGIKGGDFFSILEGLSGIVTALGGAGVFGQSFQSFINRPIPGNANGTAFHPGGLMKVGERGPEILQVPRGGRVVPNHELRAAGQAAIRIVLEERTDLVSARIDGRIAEAAPGIAGAGAELAMSKIRRTRDQALA